MDEKRAFQAMMAEISDSDSDDGSKQVAARKTNTTITADMKMAESKTSSAPPLQTNFVPTSSLISNEDREINNFGIKSESKATNNTKDYANFSRKWLLRSCHPGDPPMLCFVERHRSTLGGTTYRAFIETTGNSETGKAAAKFMMSAKKILNSRTSYYLLSMDMDPEERGSETTLGKLRGNAIGSTYLITDHGISPEKTENPSSYRKELGVLNFEFDTSGPSKIHCCIPYVNSQGVALNIQPEDELSGIQAMIDSKDATKLTTLNSKKPKWDESHGGHVLNFQVG